MCDYQVEQDKRAKISNVPNNKQILESNIASRQENQAQLQESEIRSLNSKFKQFEDKNIELTKEKDELKQENQELKAKLDSITKNSTLMRMAAVEVLNLVGTRVDHASLNIPPSDSTTHSEMVFIFIFI